MTHRYLRSTDGLDADSGATWALAKASLTGLSAIALAGDTCWVSQAHAESQTTAQSFISTGSLGNPVRLVGANDAAEPPTAVHATKPTFTNTANWSFQTVGGYFRNLSVIASGATSNLITLCDVAAGRQVWVDSDFTISSSGGAARVHIGSTSSVNTSYAELNNCRFKFGATSQGVQLNCRTVFNGGSIISGGSVPVNFIVGYTGNRTVDVTFNGFDFANLGTTANLALGGAIATGTVRVRFVNCKLPASWSGLLVSTALTTPGARFELIGSDNADTNYRLWVEEYGGSIKHELTIVRTSGGASDGTTAVSWKFVTSALTNYPVTWLESPVIEVWNDTVGSVTATIHGVYDSLTNLKDNEIWVRAWYMGTASFPLVTMIEDVTADVFTTAADQAASTETWTTTGMTNPNKFKLNVTFTTTKKGPVQLQVIVAKSSTTLYIDPLPVLS